MFYFPLFVALKRLLFLFNASMSVRSFPLLQEVRFDQNFSPHDIYPFDLN